MMIKHDQTTVVEKIAENDKVFKTYVSLTRRVEFPSEAQIREYIVKGCKDPNIVVIDYSCFGLTNGDLKYIFQGLVEREKNYPGQHGLYLLNIASDEVDEDGVREFLKLLNKGYFEQGMTRKIFPDVRQTILRIGFPVTEDFFQELITVAPSVFAGCLKIIF